MRLHFKIQNPVFLINHKDLGILVLNFSVFSLANPDSKSSATSGMYKLSLFSG